MLFTGPDFTIDLPTILRDDDSSTYSTLTNDKKLFETSVTNSVDLEVTKACYSPRSEVKVEITLLTALQCSDKEIKVIIVNIYNTLRHL